MTDFDLQPHLVGDLVELRPLREDDFDELYSAAGDPLIWAQHPVTNRRTGHVARPERQTYAGQKRRP
jgi:N-acetyltransferase